MTLGEQIKKAREERRLTQEQLAEAMEISRQAVRKWEADQSRPTAAKLARLSELLDLPPEALNPPPSPEAEALRKWQTAALVLGALCLVLAVALTAVLYWKARVVPEDPGKKPEAQDLSEDGPDTAYMFPRSTPLVIERIEDLGNQALYLPETMPEGGDVLFSGQFRGPYADGSRLEIRRTNPWEENHTTFWEVWAFWMKPDGEEEVLGRLSDYNHYVNQDGLDVELAENVLGSNCYKVSLVEGAACVISWYFTLTEDGPGLLLEASGRTWPEECDVDGDGEEEVITTYGNPTGHFIFDTARISGERRRYELTPDAYRQTPVEFDPQAGFCVRDSEGMIKARYILSETGALLLEGYEESNRARPIG